MPTRSPPLILLVLIFLAGAHAQTTLIPTGSGWRFLADGTDPGGGWFNPAFDDSSWSNGVAKLGFGGTGETTVIGDGTNGLTAFYFRNRFNVTNPAAFQSLQLGMIVDDGAVVYLNGAEVLRHNLPAGSINSQTLALAEVTGAAETNFTTNTISSFMLVAGENILAAEVHQSATNSADLGWELGLVGVPPAPPGITQNPTNQTVLAGQPATFTVAATGTPPLTYQWQKDGVPLAGATSSTLTLSNVAPGDSGGYSCAVGNSAGSVTSQVATLTVIPDTTPPHLVAATGDASFTVVTVLFDEPLDPASATEPFNYSIDGGLNITGAGLQSDGRSVILTTAAQAQDTIYTVTVNGVKDLALNTIAGDSTVPFRSFVFSRGFILFEAYNTIDGRAVSNLTSHPSFPNNPGERLFMTSFDTRTVYPDDSHENYGARITGLFVPPTSGNYVFYLKSDDAAELQLNPAGIDAAGAILIAAETACCGQFSDHASAPQPLVAGQRYFIMALSKAGTGSDYCQVAVKLDTDPADPDTLPPMNGSYLGVFADPTCASITFARQPANTTAAACTAVCFSVTATGTNCAGTNAPRSYQWQRNDGNGFIDMSGANSATFCTPVTLADHGVPFRVIVSVPGATATSQSATLTVSPDTARPTLVSASPNCTNKTVTVDFSEWMNPAEAQNAASYSIPGVLINMATLNADGKSVTLVTDALVPNTIHTLTVNGLTDLCGGNLIAPNPSQLSFQCTTAPMIMIQPFGQTLAPGDTAIFTVQASGPPPLRFAWYKDSFFIAGATNATFTLSNAQVSDVGRYAVRVSATNGAVTSLPAELAVLDSYLLDLPAGYSLIANQLHGSNNLISTVVPVVPDGTMLVKWDGAAQQFTPPDTYLAGAGWLDGSFNPSATTLAPGEGAVINLPSPQTLLFTGAFRPPTLPVSLAGGYNLVGRQIPRPGTFEQITGESPVAGSIVDQLDPARQQYRTHTFVGGEWLDGVPLAEVGEAVWIRRITLPSIIQQPVALTNVAPGTNLSFIVIADGSPPLRYQWRRNGVNIPDATNDTYFIPNAQITDAGLFSVIVQSTRVTPPLGSQGGELEDVAGAASSLTVPLTFNLTNFPFSDSFGARPNVSTFVGTLAGDNTGASLENGEPRHAGKPGGHSVWMTWIAPADGIVTFSTLGSAFDTVLAAYEGTDFSGLEIASDDDGEPFLGSRLAFNASLGQRYNISTDGFGRAAGNFLLVWNLEQTTERLPVINAQPQNQVVDLNSAAQFNVSASGINLTYQWLLDGQPIVGTSQSNYLINAVQDTNAGTYAVVVSNPDRSIVSHAALLQIQPPGPVTVAKAGGNDLLALDKFEDIVAAATNSAFPLPKPGPGRVVAHGFSGTQIFSTIGSSKQSGEPAHCGVRGGASEWFVYQPTNSGTIIIDTDGSNFDTVLAVYVGPGTDFITLTNVACDNNSGTNGRTSRVSFTARVNTIYWIAVDGVNDPITGRPAKGNVHLNYRLLLPLTLSSLSHAPAIGNGRVILRVTGTPNVAATVQAATNLASPTWISLRTNTPLSGTFLFTNTDALTFTNRLYRAIHRF